jgi:polysaccharide pyruvyl transferase WcaK-like protein
VSRHARPPHWLVVADVGGLAGFHVGDEAMLEANLDALGEALPNARVTVVSSDPAHTAVRLGVEAVGSHAVVGPAPARGALRGADGLMISGGGNMNATWAGLLDERLDLIELAHALDVPVVITGQTVGPDLTADHERRIAALLPRCVLVVVRDVPSWWKLRALGVPSARLRYQADDALGICPAPGRRPVVPRPWIAVTVSEAIGDRVVHLADELTEINRRSGLPLRIVPHLAAGAPSGAASDRALGRRLAGAISGRAPVEVPWCGGPRRVAALTAQATCVISTRYHPLVFATAARVPAIGLAADDYTRVRMVGALTHVGRERDVVVIDDAWDGHLSQRALDLIGAGDRLEQGPWETMWDRWRDGRALLVEVLRGRRPVVGSPPPPDHVAAAVRASGGPCGSVLPAADT